MKNGTNRVGRIGALVAALAAIGGWALSAAAEPVTYELLSGSTIVDDCWFCRRIPIVREITGTFTITLVESMPGAVTYSITEIAFGDAAGDYKVSGKGTYRQIVTAEPLQEIELDVEVNGAGGVRLPTDDGVVQFDWPGLKVSGTEQVERDRDHRYTLRIVAAPRPVAWTRYVLLAGSEFTDECLCGHAPITVGIEGSFLLGELKTSPSPFLTYVVTEIDVGSPTDDVYRFRGGGLYEQGGEVALTQEGQLVISSTYFEGAVLSWERQPPPVTWPAIDVTFRNEDPFDDLYRYTLHIIAKPDEAVEVQFRRGDCNADGQCNIADAIYALGYLFGQGTEPACAKAADSNDDGGVNIADAIAVLSHLFAGAGPLPAPFATCGRDPSPDELPCKAFEPCR